MIVGLTSSLARLAVDAGRFVDDANGGFHLVAMLATGAPGSPAMNRTRLEQLLRIDRSGMVVRLCHDRIISLVA